MDVVMVLARAVRLWKFDVDAFCPPLGATESLSVSSGWVGIMIATVTIWENGLRV